MGSAALKIKVIGISGKYCSGKSLITQMLRDWGFFCVDVDQIGHIVLEREQSSIVDTFGRKILDIETGGIDRRKLGQVVFADEGLLTRLEAILHPTMVDEIRQIIENSSQHPIVLDAALLFRMRLYALCQKVIWVQSPFLLRGMRSLRRDGWQPFRLFRILCRQANFLPKMMSDNTDIVIVNNTHSKKTLQQYIHNLIRNDWGL